MKVHASSASLLVLAAAACASSPPPAADAAHGPAASTTRAPITQAEVEGAQRAWCDALVGISATHAKGGDARTMAADVLSNAYAYDAGKVLFKPTLTHGKQTFRMDKQGALAYFVGGDPDYPDDTGFALKGWASCRPEIRSWLTDGDMAIAMGNVHITDGQGNQVKVDKTFGYHRGADGKLRIVLHHSSLPYEPPAKTGSRK